MLPSPLWCVALATALACNFLSLCFSVVSCSNQQLFLGQTDNEDDSNVRSVIAQPLVSFKRASPPAVIAVKLEPLMRIRKRITC